MLAEMLPQGSSIYLLWASHTYQAPKRPPSTCRVNPPDHSSQFPFSSVLPFHSLIPALPMEWPPYSALCSCDLGMTGGGAEPASSCSSCWKPDLSVDGVGRG